jgi:hypothetical protein
MAKVFLLKPLEGQWRASGWNTNSNTEKNSKHSNNKSEKKREYRSVDLLLTNQSKAFQRRVYPGVVLLAIPPL